MNNERAMTDAELAIDWATVKTQNEMLTFELAHLHRWHRHLLHACAVLICAFTLQTVILIWCLTR